MDFIRESALYTSLKPIARFVKEHKHAVYLGMAAVGLYALYRRCRWKPGIPPGPCGYPVIGNLMMFDNYQNFHVELEKLQQQYGEIVCVWFGGDMYWIILNGYDIIKEAYLDRGSDFMNRQPNSLNEYVGFIDVFSGIDDHKSNRKFCTQALRNSGFAKDRLDKRLALQWDELAGVFDASGSTPIELEKHFKRAATNIIWGVLFDKKYQHNDPELDEASQMSVKIFEALMGAMNSSLMPEWLSNITQSKQRRTAKEAVEHVTAYISKIVHEHERTYKESTMRDFVDECLKHGLMQTHGLRYITHMCLSFMIDACVTVPAMQVYVILFLIRHSDYQQRMRTEVNDALKTNGNTMSLGLKDRMPLTEAFINEMFRVVTPSLTGIPSNPMQTTKLRGYVIPKEYSIMANLYSVHYDPSIYPDPTTFNPERFLDNGKLTRADKLLPFGIGRRRCMGEQLARSELLYFTASMVTRYEIRPEDPDQLPDPTPQYTMTGRTPREFKAVLKRI